MLIMRWGRVGQGRGTDGTGQITGGKGQLRARRGGHVEGLPPWGKACFELTQAVSARGAGDEPAQVGLWRGGVGRQGRHGRERQMRHPGGMSGTDGRMDQGVHGPVRGIGAGAHQVETPFMRGAMQ